MIITLKKRPGQSYANQAAFCDQAPGARSSAAAQAISRAVDTLAY